MDYPEMDLEIDTEIQIISPDSIDKIKILELRNEKESKVDVCHGGTGRYYIPYDNDPGEFAILRRKLYKSELSNILENQIKK